MRGENTILSPTQVGLYLKGMMERDRLLSGIMVRGEISNYKMYPSGHHYFTLKDAEGAIRCVMFRGDASTLRFRPQNGMQVIAAGRVTVYPRDGQYQLYCARLTPDGAGDLHIAFEQMKEKLMREGLFDQSVKKPIPEYPKTIALITSPAGAAVRDMLRILGARFPMARIRILPVRVQGEGAANEIAAAIEKRLGRGVTVLPARGWYTGKERPMLLSAVRKGQIVSLKKLVNDVDSDAFVILQEAHQVLGMGFRRYSEDEL